MVSPLELEKQFTRIEKSTIDYFNQKPITWAPVLSLLSLLALYYFVVWPLGLNFNRDDLNNEMFETRYILYTIYVAVGLCAFYLPNSLLHGFSFLATAGGWLAISWHDVSSSWSAFAFPILILFSFGYLRLAAKRKIAAWTGAALFVIAFFTAGYWMALEAQHRGTISVVKRFWLTHPEFYLLFVLSSATLIRRPGQEYLALNPHNIAWGALWPSESFIETQNLERRRKIWWCGVWNSFVGGIFFSLAFLCKYILFKWSLPIAPRIAFSYLFYLFFVVGGFNQTIGIARFFGMNCPDPTYFLLLAKNPLETWQRGSTFMYRFFLRFIFVPIYRWTRNYSVTIVICLLVVIAHMFLFHNLAVRALYNYLVPDLRAPDVRVLPELFTSFSWALIWFFWILIGSTLWSKWLQGASPRKQWFSIFLNHLVVATIYPLAFATLAPILYYFYIQNLK